MGGRHPHWGQELEQGVIILRGAFGRGSGRPCGQQVGVPRGQWCLDLNSGERCWLEPLPSSHQWKAVTEALALAGLPNSWVLLELSSPPALAVGRPGSQRTPGSIQGGKVESQAQPWGNRPWGRRAWEAEEWSCGLGAWPPRPLWHYCTFGTKSKAGGALGPLGEGGISATLSWDCGD